MADLTKTVEIIFGGKNELGSVINDIGGGLGRMEDFAAKASEPLAGIAEKVLGLSTAFGALAVGGLAYAIKTAGEFNAKFGEITTLISDTGAPIEKFKADIKSYATDSVKSIDDINQAIYTAVSAGVKYNDSIEFVNVAEKLAVVGRSALGDTTKFLISVLNAYGASTDQAGKYSDIMFATVRGGLTTMTELSASLAQVTGLAANAGIPFETLSAAIAALTTTGMPTAQAITSIKAAIQNIIKPTGEAEVMAKSLGLQFNASALATKGFEGVLWSAWTATKGNTEKMAELFGSVEALNAVLVLAADKTGKFKTSLDDMKKSSGLVAENYSKVANELENINTRLLNSFKITIGEIGEKLMPQYGQIAGSLGDLMKGIKVGVDSGTFDPFFKYLDSVGASIAKWLEDVAKAFPDALKNVDFTGLINALKDIGKEFGDLIGDTSSESLTENIQLVVDSISSLISVTKGIGEIFTPVANSIIGAVNAFNSLDASTKELAGNLLGLGLAYKMFGPFSILMIALGSDTETATKAFSFFAAGVENGVNLIKVLLLSMALGFSKATEAMAGLLNYIPGYDGTEGIKRTAEASRILSVELDLAQKQLESSSQKVWDVMDGTVTATGKAVTGVKDIASEAAKISGAKILEIVTKLDPLSTEETQWKIAQAFYQKDYNRVMILVALAEAEAADARKKLTNTFPAQFGVTVTVGADGTSIETARDMIIKTFPDGTIYMTNIGTRADEARLAATKKKIEEIIPPVKLL